MGQPVAVGLLPMGGKGTRLGMPFAKPLAPIITHAGVEPVYRHTLRRLQVATAQVYALTNDDSCTDLVDALAADGVDRIYTNARTLTGALALAGERLCWLYGPDALAVMAFPDTLWHTDPGRSVHDVLEAALEDGALGLFRGTAAELDPVTVQGPRVAGVTTKPADAGDDTVVGWGVAAVRTGALADFRPDEADGPQLGRLRLGWVQLGTYMDLGTPERYIKWHDQRRER